MSDTASIFNELLDLRDANSRLSAQLALMEGKADLAELK